MPNVFNEMILKRNEVMKESIYKELLRLWSAQLKDSKKKTEMNVALICGLTHVEGLKRHFSEHSIWHERNWCYGYGYHTEVSYDDDVFDTPGIESNWHA